MQRSITLKAIGVTAIAVLLVWSFERVRSERAISDLLATGEQKRSSVPMMTGAVTPEQRQLRKKQWRERNLRFADIWRSRSQRNITKQVMGFLKDAEPSMRERAARGLGRLQDPQSLPVLRQMLKQDKEVPKIVLRLAIARIEVRQLKGQAKLNKVAKSVGLSWSDVVRLSQKINAPNSYAHYTLGAKVLREIVNVLYQMGKQDQDIQPWAKQLTLEPAQQILLKGAALSQNKEINLVLDYLSRLKVVKYDSDYELINRLSDLGTNAKPLLLQRIQDVVRHPERYRKGRGYYCLFYAVGNMGERRALPLLQQLEHDPDPALKSYARSTAESIKKGLMFPILP